MSLPAELDPPDAPAEPDARLVATPLDDLATADALGPVVAAQLVEVPCPLAPEPDRMGPFLVGWLISPSGSPSDGFVPVFMDPFTGVLSLRRP